MKNNPSILATPTFFSIYINGKIVKSVFNLERQGTAKNYSDARCQLEQLKNGVHEDKSIQSKFDSFLN